MKRVLMEPWTGRRRLRCTGAPEAVPLLDRLLEELDGAQLMQNKQTALNAITPERRLHLFSRRLSRCEINLNDAFLAASAATWSRKLQSDALWLTVTITATALPQRGREAMNVFF
ncbi:hypothetical protein VZT92_003532 [Zoarces viviparus]|uniref:Uncharacterized protein n=1 Tax=Zoarces viviparus TaxID=48416 RepID=A0AAW1FU37_ZOAVI